ncbi:unnamed protein product [Adineta steineri]|uniref:Uncharacterized protein n=1 Tax=Adineta steineri TaxID=433720 RepID=A0A815PAJ5_9BILA|nr:unnamed protein product [Adineta steineri]
MFNHTEDGFETIDIIKCFLPFPITVQVPSDHEKTNNMETIDTNVNSSSVYDFSIGVIIHGFIVVSGRLEDTIFGWSK